MNLMGLVFIIGSSLAFVMGGKPVAGGFFLSYEVISRTVNFTPIAMFQIGDAGDEGRLNGLTLGGLVVMNNHNPALQRYELQHVYGWAHYGLEYGLRILAQPCDFDPAAGWAHGCNSWLQRAVDVQSLPMNHFAFSVRF